MRNYKKLAVVIAIMILTLSIASTGFAANTMKTLQAYYRNITIFRNGTQASFTHEPFIVDGTTYVPVRDMSQLLGKNVTFNPQTYRIDITDVADASTVALQTKVIQQEITIKNLEDKVKNLEAQLAANQSSKPTNATLSEMEDYLNDEYGSDSDVDFEITLSGSKSKIELGIYVNDRTSSNRFANWTNSDKKSFAEELVDEILDEFTTATISGFYKDDYARTSKQSFSVSKSGKVTMGGTSSSIFDLEDLEDELNSDYYYKGNVDFSIEVRGTTSKIILDIDAYNDDLDDLDEYKIKSYLEEIYRFIMNELNPSSIEGTIYDAFDYYEFDFNSSGRANLY